MKNLLKLLAGLAFTASAFTVTAQTLPPRLVFAGTGTAISTTNSHYIVPANGVGAPVITYIDATGDTSPSVLRFFTASSPAILTAATAASPGTNLTCVGSAFSANDIIVLWHKNADTYERLVVASASATNVTTTAGIAAAAVAGDVIWKMSSAGTASGFTNTSGVQRTAQGGLFASDVGKPIMVNLTGTNTPTLNSVGGYYAR